MSEPAADAPPATAEAPPAPPAKRSLKERLSAHMAEYGKVAVYTYLVLSLSAIVGFSIAIGMGVEPSTPRGVLGVIGAGWVAAKATMPLRILATLGLTPVVAAVIKKYWPPKPKTDDDDDDDE